MTSKPILPPEDLAGDTLLGRVRGDALHLVELAHDHGAQTIGQVLAAFGPDHAVAVVVALAEAVDVDTTARRLWPGPQVRTSRSLTSVDLWRLIPPNLGDDDPGWSNRIPAKESSR